MKKKTTRAEALIIMKAEKARRKVLALEALNNLPYPVEAPLVEPVTEAVPVEEDRSLFQIMLDVFKRKSAAKER